MYIKFLHSDETENADRVRTTLLLRTCPVVGPTDENETNNKTVPFSRLFSATSRIFFIFWIWLYVSEIYARRNNEQSRLSLTGREHLSSACHVVAGLETRMSFPESLFERLCLVMLLLSAASFQTRWTSVYSAKQKRFHSIVYVSNLNENVGFGFSWLFPLAKNAFTCERFASISHGIFRRVEFGNRMKTDSQPRRADGRLMADISNTCGSRNGLSVPPMVMPGNVSRVRTHTVNNAHSARQTTLFRNPLRRHAVWRTRCSGGKT